MNNSITEHRKKEIHLINHLLEICNERVSGYSKAASATKDQELKDLFHQLSLQTEGLIQQLLEFIKGTKSMHQGTRRISDVWETWMDLKSAITNGGRKAMLSACITGEESAIRNFKQALKEEDTSPEFKQLVKSSLEQIENTYKNIKAIKNKI